MRSLPLLLLALACRRPPPDTDGPAKDTVTDGVVTDTDTDTVTDTDTDTVTDTPTTPPETGTAGSDTGTAGCAGIDADGDGVDACTDCDDADPETWPGAPERCDERDNDCDGSPLPDEGPACAACDAAGLWLSTRELSGDPLRTELVALTAAHTCSDYSTETTFMFVDLDNDNGEVECVYTGRRTPIVGGQKPDPTDMNTEHSWPQSQGAGSPPAQCDLHHLYPADADTNNARANYPFGEVNIVDESFDGGSLLGLDLAARTVFEPRDVHKGNVARSMAYFAMHYGYTLSASDVALYQSWSLLDPPDQAEIDRTLAISARQGAPNPYVLCPDLLDRW
ncbi:MAG: endonuclease [Myxococcota bacterium]